MRTSNVKPKEPNSLLTFVIVAGCSICFCSKGVLIKLSFLADADPLTILALRMAFAFPVFSLCAGVLNWRAERRISGQEWGMILGLGFIGYYFSPLVNFAGLQYVSVGLERLILYTYPTFVVMGGMLLFGQTVSRATWIAVGLTYAGIVIAFSGEAVMDGTRSDILYGSGLILLSALSYSLFVLFSRRLILALGAIRFTANVLSVSCVFTFIHFLTMSDWNRLPETGSKSYTYAILLAVFGTILPSFLMGIGLRRAGSQRFAVLSTIGPVATVLLAWAFLGEAISASQLLGLVFTLSGGVLISLFKATDSKTKEDSVPALTTVELRPRT